MKPNYKTRLLAIVDGLGDCIAATPAIRGFGQDFPDVELYVLTWGKHGCHDVFEFNPYVKKTFAVDGSFDHQYVQAQILGFRPEEICILDNIVHYGEFCKKCGNSNIDKWISVLSSLHANLVDIYCLQLIGRTPKDDERVPQIYVDEKDLKYAESLKDFQPYILINHSTRTDVDRKAWSLANWHAIINLLLEKFPKLNVLTIGDQNTAIIPIENKRYKAIRDTKVRELIGIAANSKYTVCCQSGIAHLLDTLPEIPGLQVNIGSPKALAGRQSPNVTVVDQKEIFGGHTITINEVWETLEHDLNRILPQHLIS